MNRSLPLLLICSLLLTACTSDNGPAARCDHNLPERNIWQPPAYPGAQPDQTTWGPMKGTRIFTTHDPPTVVLTFYEQELRKQGWKLQAKPTPLTNERIFGIANCCFYGSTSVTTEPSRNGQTTVTLTIFWGMGCG